MSISELKSKRSTIKGKLTRLSNYIQKEQYDITQISSRYEELKTIYTQYDEVQTAIEFVEKATEAHEQDRQAVEEQYYATSAAYRSILDSRAATQSCIAHDKKENLQHIRLPQLELPTFDGKLKEWPNFKNIFQSIIGDANIPKIQKLQYLKSSLKGEAAALVSSLFISEENYDKALHILSNRYENKVIIINYHLKSFVNYQQVTRNNLKDFLLTLQQSLDSLNALNIATYTWDVLLVFIITQKLDNSLRAAWELSRKDMSVPTYEELFNFLSMRMTAFDLINDKNTDSNPQPIFKPKVSYSATVESKENECNLCNGQNMIYRCPDFLKMSPERRNQYFKQSFLCFNCLKPYKPNHHCSKHKCLTCHRRHHSVLHMDHPLTEANTFHSSMSANIPNNIEQVPSTSHAFPTSETLFTPSKPITNVQPGIIQQTSSVVNTAMTKQTNKHILLSTALIRFQDATCQWHNARALLDSGSEVNLITSRLALKLKHTLNDNQCTIKGISSSNLHSNKSLFTHIASRTSSYKSNITCLVMDNITVKLPHTYIHVDNWNMPLHASHSLADPCFNIPGEIDMLIGAEFFYDILTRGHISLGHNMPHLINSAFGWIISGTLILDTQVANQSIHTLTCLHICADNDSDKLLPKWEQEDLVHKQAFTPDEPHYEQLYRTSTNIDLHDLLTEGAMIGNSLSFQLEN